MNARILTLLLWVLPGTLAAQGYGGLGATAEGYAQVLPDTAITFPADHAAHPGFRIEWWYLTANLTTADGTPMGLQWTLFRNALQPGDTGGEGWQAAQVWMGHAAVTTPQTHIAAEVFARGGIGQAGVTMQPFEAWIDDWTLRGDGTGNRFDGAHLAARADRFAYALDLTATGPLVLQGAGGYSVKSTAAQASYYYSQPFLTVSGAVTVDGTRREVTGTAWLDREWSSQPPAADQTGWDWFSLHLPAGDKLMVYRIRTAAGGAATGTYIAADGTPEPLPLGAVTLTPLARAQVAGREIPIRWRLQLPSHGIDIATSALNPQSYMATRFPYWEGPIEYQGSHAGVGYLEMTGY